MSERQSVRAVKTSLSTDNWNRERMQHWRPEVATADAKKAGSASDAARRIPKLPGVLACIHCLSDMCMFTIANSPSRSTASCSSNRGWSKQGEHRKKCMRRGVLKYDLRMINGSYAGKRVIRLKAVRSLATLSAKPASRALPLLSGAPRRVLSLMVNAMKSLSGPERVRFEMLDLEMTSLCIIQDETNCFTL